MLNPLNWLLKIGPTGRKATELYGSIVTQARLPVFYRELGVPDTTSGRYEMLVLHISCVLNALRLSQDPGGRMARALIEAFVADMDDTMRELGIGDMSVPKKVKKTAAGLRERTIAYRGADNDDGHLAKKIAGYFEMPPDSPTVRALVAYSVNLARSLEQAQAEGILNDGKVSFPAVPAAPLAKAVAQDGSSNLRA